MESKNELKTIVPALPDSAIIYKSVTPLSAEEIMHNHTRLQILHLTNGYCLPDKSCMLSEIIQNRTSNDEYKLLTVSEFLAISLVRTASVDVVAVSMDQVNASTIKITVARNESTDADVGQAELLRKVFERHFFSNSTSTSLDEFRNDYFATIIAWGAERIAARVNALNYAGSNKGGPKSAVRAEKLIVLDKVMDGLDRIAGDGGLFSRMKEIQEMYIEINAKTQKTSRTSTLRGDFNILKFAEKSSVLEVAKAWLDFVRAAVKRFNKESVNKPCRLFNTDYFDINDFSNMTLICDFLGSSQIFEDLLDLSAVGTPQARFQFLRSLRKVGAYRYGTGLLFDSMKTCRGKSISKIDVTVLNAPENLSVDCVEDWYGFVRKEAKKVNGQELTATAAFLEAGSGLKRYESKTLAVLHAELNLAIHRRRAGVKYGEIGVSKDCCATCLAGLAALKRSGCNYTIKVGHAKPYIARLTNADDVNRFIIKKVKEDFEQWLRQVHMKPDSDVSDHEMSKGDMLSLQEAKFLGTVFISSNSS